MSKLVYPFPSFLKYFKIACNCSKWSKFAFFCQFQAELQGSESPETLRIASSTANKAHSWRGDHPMKSGAGYFQSNPSLQPPNPNNPNTNNTGSYYAHQGSKTFNPYHAGKPSYEFGQKQTNFLQSAQSGGKVIHNGIRLVGLANSPNDSK